MRVVNARPNTLAVAALDLNPADRVLEVGCGPGHALRLMAARVSRGTIHGIDPSPVMLAQARRRNQRACTAGRIRLCRARAEQLPFADSSFDKILAVNVAYFWLDPVGTLAEIRRVLRPRGVLSVYVTDAPVMRRWPFARAETHRLFDRAEVTCCFRDAGFAQTDFGIVPVRISRFVTGLIATARLRRGPGPAR